METKKLIFYLLLSFPILGISQARIVINDDAFITINNSVKLVVDNFNPNAVTVEGSGANIISEGEENNLVWYIRNGTGTYSIPWTTRPVIQGGNGTKIPMDMQITSPGDVNGHFYFSTYETNDFNLPMPSVHSNVNSLESPLLGMNDASLYLVDRYWILENSSYTAKPSAILSFTYDDAPNEIGGSNLLVEANLRAQRWNSSINSWELALFGTTNTATNRTTNIVATAADFFSAWVLVDFNFPLPVDLKSQSISSNECINSIQWITASEQNNAYFNIERSQNLQNWTQIAQIEGAGNSSNEREYMYHDEFKNGIETVYYRISQTDFDGTKRYYEPMVTKMACSESNFPFLFPNPTTSTLNIQYSGDYSYSIFDATGKKVIESFDLKDNSSIQLESLANGFYSLQLYSKTSIYSLKFIKK